MLINNHESQSVTPELWIVRKGATAGTGGRRIIPKYVIPANGDAQEHNIFIPLRSGDSIEGRASVGEMIDYVIGFCVEM